MTELREKLNNIVEEKNTKITPENLRQGVEAFGVQGTFTSDATATAEDIAKDKTAYVNGEKVVGTLEASDFDGSEITSSQYMFWRNTDITEAPIYNSKKTKTMSNMFASCTNLVSCGSYNTENVTSFGYMFSGCTNLTTVDILNMEKATSFNDMFNGCSKLTNLGGFANLGKAFMSTASAGSYKIDLSVSKLLTHDSLMNVINNAYDLKQISNVTQTIRIGNKNKAKLTAEEIAIATNKYWSIQ